MTALYNTTMSKPFFSIIIPTLNEAKYLPHLLTNLTNQTFPDFEIIIVDGKSTDKTVALAQAFQTKLKLKIITSPTRHVCVQRNLGAQHASADVLIFSDADNSLPPYFLQGIKYRWESEKVDLLSCWLKPDILSPQNKAVAQAINTFLELQNNVKPSYLLESFFVVNAQIFSKIGGFAEDIDYAEGKSLISRVYQFGFRSKVVRDPTYTFSFRRFRKYGILGVAGRVATMELSELLGPKFHSRQARDIYPMLGGSIFTQPKKSRNKFLKNIQKLLQNL